MGYGEVGRQIVCSPFLSASFARGCQRHWKCGESGWISRPRVSKEVVASLENSTMNQGEAVGSGQCHW